MLLPAVCYYVFGGVGYVRLGSQFDFDRPVTSILPANLWSSLANAGLLAHCIIAYMVRQFSPDHDTDGCLTSFSCTLKSKRVS